MRTKGVNKEQQLKYILECRNSGLTDYQWCQEHGIHPGTFYNWPEARWSKDFRLRQHYLKQQLQGQMLRMHSMS